MRKAIIIISVLMALGCTAIALFAQNDTSNIEDSRLQELERLAEQGDTAALHSLILYLDDRAVDYVEVVEVYDPETEEFLDADSINQENQENAENSAYYKERLDYWLDKGLAINDPIAIAVKGMRLYYTDETESIKYLSRAADLGNCQAALFCGSAAMNQGKGDEAFKYLTQAYNLGAPSAGWHLAMCYSAGIGTTPNREKAIEVMRHAAMLNYPEAVSEMRRIEPINKIWHQKADSIGIDFADFPIIPDK